MPSPAKVTLRTDEKEPINCSATTADEGAVVAYPRQPEKLAAGDFLDLGAHAALPKGTAAMSRERHGCAVPPADSVSEWVERRFAVKLTAPFMLINF